ncbi:DUF4236 domain-containing protein [Aliidiomarina indica]|uniref:DUF4236 domain-containing protein n=1 Tax=Aliidiomarina indica TaxID=2749147 RepID=UPI001890115E|nr:DUF4236 domain-containing protein [Aliidiomarina indica]
MAFRFHRRVRILPGVRLNFSKSGVSASAGIRGASITAGKRGVWSNVGAPGTGLSYRSRLDKSPAHQRRVAREQQRSQNESKISVQLTLDDRGQLLFRGPDGQAVDKSIERQLWQQQSESIYTFLQNELERINDDNELLLNIHHDTPALSTEAPEFVPVNFNHPHPQEPKLPASPEPPRLPRRWFWHAWFPRLAAKRDTKARTLQQEWESENQRINSVRTELQQEYADAVALWTKQRDAHRQEQLELQKTFVHRRDHDVTFMEELLEHELAELDWPRETLIDFDIQQHDNVVVFIDVDLPTTEAFPSRSAEVSKTGKRLLIKDKSATQQRKEYMQHIHGVIFRLIGVAFVTLPSVNHLIVSGYTQQTDQAMGHETDSYLISVKITRDQWSALNLDAVEKIDPVTALEQFTLIRDMTKTGIFRPISPHAS